MSKFIWQMTNEDYQEYIKVQQNKGMETSRDFYGKVSINDYDVEFHHTLDSTSSNWYGYTEVYEKTDDDRYDMQTHLGTIMPPKSSANTFYDFETFKSVVEHQFSKELIKNNEIKNRPDLLNDILESASPITNIYIAEQGIALDKLVNNDNENVRKAVAFGAKGNIEILKQLATDENADVRKAVAKYSNGNPEILSLLVNDESDYVRMQVAKQGYNLEAYVNDESPLVRIAVAENEKTPSELLVYLANDENWEAREYVAARGIALDVLVNDPDENVRCAALSYITKNYPNYEDVLQDFIKDPSDKVRATLAHLGYGLDILADDASQSVREAAIETLRQQKAIMSNELMIVDTAEDNSDISATYHNYNKMTYKATYVVNIGNCDGHNDYEVEMVGKSYGSGKDAVAYITNPANLAVCTEDHNHVFPLPKEFVDKLERFIEEKAIYDDKIMSFETFKSEVSKFIYNKSDVSLDDCSFLQNDKYYYMLYRHQGSSESSRNFDIIKDRLTNVITVCDDTHSFGVDYESYADLHADKPIGDYNEVKIDGYIIYPVDVPNKDEAREILCRNFDVLNINADNLSKFEYDGRELKAEGYIYMKTTCTLAEDAMREFQQKCDTIIDLNVDNMTEATLRDSKFNDIDTYSSTSPNKPKQQIKNEQTER